MHRRLPCVPTGSSSAAVAIVLAAPGALQVALSIITLLLLWDGWQAGRAVGLLLLQLLLLLLQQLLLLLPQLS